MRALQSQAHAWLAIQLSPDRFYTDRSCTGRLTAGRFIPDRLFTLYCSSRISLT